MECFDRFKKKMEKSGNSLRNEKIISSRNLLKETFADDASYKTKIYFWELNKKESDYEKDSNIPIRFYKERFSNANGVMIKFQTLIENPIMVGDILYNYLTKEYWICTESFNINDIHWQGKLTLCNWILRWQSNTGEILNYPCYDINSTQYNSGEQSNRQFTIGSSQHMITLPCDDNTVILSSPQRFYLDKNKQNPTSFIVTQNDSTSYNYGEKGLIKLTLYECANNNETDRPDLGICDFKEEMIIDKNNKKDLKIKSKIEYSKNVIKSGGSYQKFIAKFYDNNNNEIKKNPKWDIICDFKDSLKIEEKDDYIKIKINNDDCVDEEFKLILCDENNDCKSEMLIRVESLL